MDNARIKELFIAKLGDRSLPTSAIDVMVELIKQNFPGDDVTEEQINTAVDSILPLIDLNLPRLSAMAQSQASSSPTVPLTNAEKATEPNPADSSNNGADISSHIEETPAPQQPEDPLKTFAQTGKFTPDDEGQIEADETPSKEEKPTEQPDPLADMLDLKSQKEEERTKSDEGVINAEEHTKSDGQPTAQPGPSATDTVKAEDVAVEETKTDSPKSVKVEEVKTEVKEPSATKATTTEEPKGVQVAQEANKAVEEAKTAVEEAQKTATTSTDSDVQAQIDALKAQNEKLATELAQKIESDKRTERTNQYRQALAPISGLDSLSALLLQGLEHMTFASDEDFNSFLNSTAEQVKKILQESSNRGLKMTAPGIGNSGTEANLLAQQISARTNELLKKDK